MGRKRTLGCPIGEFVLEFEYQRLERLGRAFRKLAPSMVEKVSPVIKRVRVDRMIPEAASALDCGPEIVRNAAMKFHPRALSANSTGAHIAMTPLTGELPESLLYAVCENQEGHRR